MKSVFSIPSPNSHFPNVTIMYKFTGFTEKANRALNCAVETAENLGHTYVGSEHLLCGILQARPPCLP